MKPVMFPPGRAAQDEHSSRGSLTTEKTIGIVRVACFSAAMTGELLATISSGAELAGSAVRTCIRAKSPLPNRCSI